jgi:sulfite exporter TauE/SafE
MTGWLETVVLAAFVAGLMGGLHCAAMCGGIVCLLNGQPQGLRRAPSRLQSALAYNAGRIMSYTFAGALAGSAGQAGLLLRGSLPVQQVLMFAAGLTLCLMALYLAGISPFMRAMEAAGAVLWRQVEPHARRMLPVNSTAKAFGLGTLWGWLPCGMVYTALWVMLAFGLGTLPHMLLISGLASRMRQATRRRGPRLAVAGMLGAAGLYGVMHAAHLPAMDIAGYYCRIAP